MVRGALLLVLAWAAVGVLGCSRDRADALSALSGGSVPRRFASQYSIPTEFRACTYGVLAVATSKAPLCGRLLGGAPSQSVVRIGEEAARHPTDARASRADAIIRAAWADTAGKAITGSISTLEMIARLSPTDAGLLTDLAAARIARAQQLGTNDDLLAAIDASARAVAAEPKRAAAWFNLAVAEELMGLDAQAADSWRAFLALDASSGWSKEARDHMAALQTLRRQPPKLPDTASVATVEAFARSMPQEARIYVWTDLFERWGRANENSLNGDPPERERAEAELVLRQAETIANVLAAAGADSSTIDAVRAIHASASDGRARAALAGAHVRYAIASRAFRSAAYDSALRSFSAAESMATASPSLRIWARLGRATALLYAVGSAAGAAALDSVAQSVSARWSPVLVGRALWSFGLANLRLALNDAGLTPLRVADSLFIAAGESEDAAGVEALEADASELVGNDRGALFEIAHALDRLRGHPYSTWRHNAMLLLERQSSARGLTAALGPIEDEDDRAVSGGASPPLYLAEARIGRAASAMVEDDSASARLWADRARRSIDDLPPTVTKISLRWRLSLTEAALDPDPTSSVRTLDGAVEFFAPRGETIQTLIALIGRAGSKARLGDEAGAERDLRTAASLYDTRRKDVRDAEARAGLAKKASQVAGALAMIRLRRSDTLGAAAAVDWGFRAFSPTSDAAPRTAAFARPAQGVLVEAAQVGDTVLIWAVRHDTVAFRRLEMSQNVMRAITRQTVGALDAGQSDRAYAGLRQLYSIVIRPIDRVFGRGDSIVAIAATGELASIPFAALIDRTGTFFAASHVVRMVTSSASVAVPQSRRQAAPAESVPTFVAAADGGGLGSLDLPSLAGARREVERASAAYSKPIVRYDDGMDSATFAGLLRRASVFHFAGHALVDDVQPERSRLVVTKRGVRPADVAALDLSRVQVVVLSACATMRAGGEVTSRFGGFADAFLSAGARGVVGSLWDVDDAATERFMARFHGLLAGHTSAPVALNIAQREAIRRGESVSSWAAFSYVGQ